MTTYERLLQMELEGRSRVNRPGFSTATTRRWKKLVGKNLWFRPKEKEKEVDQRRGQKRPPPQLREGEEPPAKRRAQQPIEGVLYLPYTPNSELKKLIQENNKIFNSSKVAGRVRVCERLGATIKELICNPTPWSKKPCGRQDCVTCPEKGGQCKKVGVTYQITCTECKDQGKVANYWGETSRSFWDRMVEHVDLLRRMEDASPLYKHWREAHSNLNKPPEFKFKVIGSYKTSLERQLREALLIMNDNSDLPMNNKSEFGYNSVVRLSAEDSANSANQSQSASPRRKKRRNAQFLESQTERESERGSAIAQGVQQCTQTHPEQAQSARIRKSASISDWIQSARQSASVHKELVLKQGPGPER